MLLQPPGGTTRTRSGGDGAAGSHVDTGFVRREPHPTDRRATLVHLTDQGARTAADLAAGQDELARLLFARMPAATFTGLLTGLDAVLERLRPLVAGAGEPPEGEPGA